MKTLRNHILGQGPYIMGVLNVTPDSFYDGGRFAGVDKAIERGLELIRQGADILDIGGESSRPGAQPVDPQEETERIRPVIAALAGHTPWLSIDTRNAAVMEAALEAGANIINDISALSHDPRSVSVAAAANVPVILMHMRGVPETMQENIKYNNVLNDVSTFLQERIKLCETHRIDEKRIVIDPGIGFGKTPEQNTLILRNIKTFCDFGVPVLLGVSRKSFIAAISAGEAPDERFPGSIAAALWGLSQGVQIFRVHDVKETRQAFKIYRAISESGGPL